MMKLLAITLVILLSVSVLPLMAEISEPILIGVGKDAKWSPDEINVSFISHGFLFVKNIDSDSSAKVVYAGSILKYEWLDDSTLVTQDRVMIPVENGYLLVGQIVQVPLNGEPTVLDKDSVDLREKGYRLRLVKFSDGSVGYWGKIGSERMPTLLSAPRENSAALSDRKAGLHVRSVPSPRGKVWLFYGDGRNGRQVTLSENHYTSPKLAPTGDKFFCTSSRGDLVIFDTLGNELSNHGRVGWERWAEGGRHIFYIELVFSHYDEEAGDIFIAKYDGSEKRQITELPDVIETGGEFSPSSRYVLYHNNRTREIHVVRLK